MDIYRLPVLSDNYIFLLHDPQQAIAAVVDPAEAAPVLSTLRSLNAELVAIFNTHHQGDHVGGNARLLKEFPQAAVYGGDRDRGRIPGQQVYLNEGDRVTFGGRTAQVYFVPGHTKAHIAYYFEPLREAGSRDAEATGHLFCGDTLFAGGCGRLFEGTPAQMMASLSKLRSLPEDTQVWCAHEYTLNNLKFAQTVDGANPALLKRLAHVEAVRQVGEPTIPSTIGLEKQTNPFLRWDQPALQQRVGAKEPAKTFAKLRGMKDLF
ncbi:MAG: hydroxyacylglutathione hydrolase [Elainellaceae cyanobacterium]